MKFTPKEDFLVERTLFEAGNTYDSAKQGVSDNDVLSWYSAGWAEVEGKDAAPERKPGAVEMVIDSAGGAHNG